MSELERAIEFYKNYIDGHGYQALLALQEKQQREIDCAWCKGDWTDNFSVFDEDFGHWLTYRHVKYCPMCGKELKR